MATQTEPQLDMALDEINRRRNQAMLDFAKRVYEPQLAELEAELARLRERAQRAEAESAALLEAMHNTSAELGADYIDAIRWARAWKQAAKEHWKNTTLSLGTIERSIESPVVERAEMALARYVIRQLLGLIEDWEYLPAMPRWLQDEAERLTVGVGDPGPCLRCNGTAHIHLSRGIECDGCGRIQMSCNCEWHNDGPIGNGPETGVTAESELG